MKEAMIKMIDRFSMTSGQEFIEKIGQSQYVSFDIFDTLVKRSVAEPKDIFSVVVKRFNEVANAKLDDDIFSQKRTQAEHAARALAMQRGKEEISLYEIYEQLPERYSIIRDALLHAEIEAEKSCCHPNPVMSKVFHWCKEQGKYILITSDMYLPQKTIEDILHQCGYFGYKKLYLSSAIGKTKRSGSLFAHALFDLGITPRELVHIGDDLRSDWFNAKIRHIKALRIARSLQMTKFTRLHKMPANIRRQFAPVASVMNGYIDPEWDDCYQFGFECLGPILYGFCKWLHQSVTERKLEHIFFFSRDGYLMQKGYQMLFGAEAVPNTYLYISRRFLYQPQIWIHPEFKDIMALYGGHYATWDCDTFCEKIGADVELGRSAWKECGLEDLVYHHEKEQNVAHFYEYVKEDVIQHSKENYDLIVEYLAQENFAGNIAVVDIGWTGNMQLCLQEIITHSTLPATIQGFYIGLLKDNPVKGKAVSFIPAELYPQIGIASIWELLFCAQHGSAKSCIRTEQGNITPTFYDAEPRNQEEHKKIEQFQEGALNFIRIAKEGMCAYSLDGTTASQNLLIAGRKPRDIELSLFADCLYFDVDVFPLAKPKGISAYLRHPKDAKRDFANCTWKVGFMKRLLKIPLPYWSIYKVLRRWAKGE